MHAAGQFSRKNFVNHAMARDSALPTEGFRYDIDMEVGFAARPVSGMAFMAVRFIDDFQKFRRKRGAELFGHAVLDRHVRLLGQRYRRVNHAAANRST
jgi:hypothetical protein